MANNFDVTQGAGTTIRAIDVASGGVLTQLVAEGAVDSGGWTVHKTVSAASTNATSVKASAGRVRRVIASNVNASVRYLKLYNKASAPTVGTDVPVFTICMGGGTTNKAEVFEIDCDFSTGIAFATTTEATDAGSTGISASESVIHIIYK